MGNEERKKSIEFEFLQRYGHAPTHWVRAPGRVDLMGSHTDYNDGFVLTMTINRDAWIAASPRDDSLVNIYSMNIEGGGVFDLNDIQHDAEFPWTNYVRGVAALSKEDNLPLRGFNGLIHSTVPSGSGVSSSAALEVATATLFRILGNWEIEPLHIAFLCQRAENQFVGMSCGILDQYTSLLGREGSSLMLDCRNLTSENVPIDDGIRVVICDTRVKRELTGSEYSERRAQCERGAAIFGDFYPEVTALRDVSLGQLEKHKHDLPEIVARRCQFIIEEIQRVLEMGEALKCGSDSIRNLTCASYVGARDLYKIGSPEMESMMNAMMGAPGVIGARQAGAGFGGCMVAFVQDHLVVDFITSVKASYSLMTGITPDVYSVRAVDGADQIEEETFSY